MYPPQTSLIPATVALSRFFEEQGFSAFLQNYPFWYLSSTPYRYLTGPIIPLISASLHKVLSDVTLFDITIWLIVVTYVLSAAGWLLLIKRIQETGNRVQDGQKSIINNSIIIILLLIFPWRLFSSFALNEASFTIARNLLPWVLLAFWGRFSKGDGGDLGNWGRGFLPLLSLSFLLFINTSILPIFLVGLASLVLAKSFRKGRFKAVSSNFKKVVLITFYSLLFTIFYYTPGYWLTILANPSIGGASGIKVFFRIFDLLKASVPLILAIIAVYFSGKVKSKLAVFSLVWILTFGFLTLFRFIGDWDFWMDWTTWFSEIEVGVGILLAQRITKIWKTRKFQINTKLEIRNSKQFDIGHLTFVILLLLPFYLTWRVNLALGKPKLISQEIPQGIQSLEKLKDLAKSERVFLSGSTVFWANALYDIYQVRGGKDQLAKHPSWDKAAYELREGNDSQKSREWLNELDVSYVLVHEQKSYEYYHDFKNINKWKTLGAVIWESEGDAIYEIY